MPAQVGGGVGILDDRGLNAGDIRPFQCEIYTLRHMAQRTLRGLGEKPREDLSSTHFCYLGSSGGSARDRILRKALRWHCVRRTWGPPIVVPSKMKTRRDPRIGLLICPR